MKNYAFFFNWNTPRDESISSRKQFPLRMQFLFFFVLFVSFVVASFRGRRPREHRAPHVVDLGLFDPRFFSFLARCDGGL